MAVYVQGALHPQSESSSINFIHTAYRFYIPSFSCFLVDAEVFSPFLSYIFITIYWMFNSWLLKHAVFDSMNLNFASFRPVCVGKTSVWAAWNMLDGAVPVQAHKHHQPETMEQWEPLWWPLQCFLACHKKTIGNQRSLETSRRKFMKNSEILCMRKTLRKSKGLRTSSTFT